MRSRSLTFACAKLINKTLMSANGIAPSDGSKFFGLGR